MQIAIDGSAAKSAASALFALVVASLAAAYGATKSVASRSVTAASRGVTAAGDASRRLLAKRSAVPFDRLSGTLRTALFGRRLDVSAVVLFVAPVLALATHYWASSVGYRQIRGWVHGTWFGTDPRLVVFLGVGALLALAALSAASNAGLLPTALLVTAPVFGVAFARYGLNLQYYGTVGIPNAVEVGVALAVAFGVPIACGGFVLGTVVRRTVNTLRGDRGATPNVERV